MDPQAAPTYGWQRPPEQVGPAPGSGSPDTGRD